MTEEIHKTYTLCQELIWLTPSSSTYCMREKGHEGDHYPYAPVSIREECTTVPEGVSLTETKVAWYINIRPEPDKIFHIRVRKSDFNCTTELMVRDASK